MQSRIQSQEIYPNIYWVSKRQKVMLYAPYKKIVTCGWSARLSKSISRFFPDAHVNPEVVLLPTTITLDLTHLCPLSCVYCSIDDSQNQTTLNIQTIKKAIDIIIKNALSINKSTISIIFGGGGEPTLAWDALKETVAYTSKKTSENGISSQFIIATGGILDKQKVEWLARKMIHIVLSFDGPEIVQNTHRPLLNNKGSYSIVFETASLLKGLNANFSIRASISNINADLSRLYEFFCQFTPEFLNFQPIVYCGRCRTTNWKGLSPHLFVEEFIKAERISKKKGIPLIFPTSRIDRIIYELCHAYNGTGFVLTNNGMLSACARVLSRADQLADLFIYGEYKEGDFKIDQDKLNTLHTIKIEHVPDCVNCFCRWHCCGGCLNDHLCKKESRGNPYSKRTNDMCYIAKELVWHQLWKTATNN